MKKIKLLGLLLCLSFSSFALNVTIIESTSYNSGQVMDGVWQSVATGMGHTATIMPQTTLDNNAFFATTDILIVSSGVINIPANRIATILAFLQTGKPVYLETEYQSSFDSNQAFASIVSSLGGTFTWSGTVAGTLAPMAVLGTFATTNNNVPSISYFWYGDAGTGDCNTIPFLEFNNQYFGWQYVPSNPAWGNIITTCDQDWVNQSTSLPLMENIITHLINPGFISGPSGGVNLGNDTTICIGNQLVLNATSTNATYLWQDNSTNATYTVTSPGTYFVTVSGTCGISRDTIVVNFSPPPVVDLGNDTTLCQGGLVTLDATTSNSTYVWSNNTTNPTLTVSTTGTYWVNVAVNGGCSVRDSINVTFNPAPVTDLGNDTAACIGQNLVLNGGNATNYLWSTGATSSTISVGTSGMYWVQMSTGQCSSSDTINVTFSPVPNINLGNDTTLCQGQQITINATTANATYTWSNNTTNPTLTISTSGTYWADVNVNGCSARDSVQVSFIPVPVANLGNDITLCAGQSAVLNGGNATNYLWSTSATTSTISVNTSGMYWVQMSTGQCSDSDTINVTFLPVPNINLGADFPLCIGQSTNLNAGQATNYLWSDGSTNQSITISAPGTYWVVADNSQCSASDTIVITSEDCSVVLVLPNVFTPNGDGSNDPFTPVLSKGITALQTSIYNRWGQLVYTSDNLAIDWDGKVNGGNDAVDGVYYWVINYTDLLGKTASSKGFVTLVR